MKNLIAENSQEEMVIKYFEAFAARNINGMMQHMHPAIHYLRTVNGKLETVINGIEHFRYYITNHAILMDEKTLELSRGRSDRDFLETKFSIYTNPTDVQEKQHLTGRTVFWFMDDQILQLVVQLEMK